MNKFGFIAIILWHCSIVLNCNAQLPSLEEIVREHSSVNERTINAGGYSRSIAVSRSGDSVSSSKTLVDYKSGSVLFENRDNSGSPYYVNTVYSISPTYCFKLTSKGNANWGLDKYVISNSLDVNLRNVGLGADYTRPQNMQDNVSVFPSVRAIGGSNISLPNLFKFTQISGATIKQLNSSAIELTFDRTITNGYHPDGEKSLAGKKTKCSMILGASPPYLPVSFSESYENQLTIASTIEYEKPSQYDGRIVQRVTENWQNNKSELLVTTDLVVAIPSKREFLLSHYGFNEPSEFREKGFSTFGIFVGSGAILVFGGVVLRLFRRKGSQ